MLTFFDFCSGIGTARIALEAAGMKCVGHSEIDPKAEQTYNLFFENSGKNWGDLMQISPSKLPDFDLMVAGFPCQTFSIVGKRNGMNDERGQIIHGLCKTLKQKQPTHFLLENVKGLLNHDKGKTLAEILRLLDEAGYTVEHQILKSTDYGVPQIRERLFFIGTRKDIKDSKFSFPTSKVSPTPLHDYLIDRDEAQLFDFSSKAGETLKKYLDNKYNTGKFSLNKILQHDYLILDTRQSDLRLYENVIPTLRTGRHGILYVYQGQLRRLSGLEALLLQGIPRKIAEKSHNVSQTSLLSQAGNAMTVNVVQAIATSLI